MSRISTLVIIFFHGMSHGPFRWSFTAAKHSWRFRMSSSCHRVICGALLQICSLPTSRPPRRGTRDMCGTTRMFHLEHNTYMKSDKSWQLCCISPAPAPSTIALLHLSFFLGVRRPNLMTGLSGSSSGEHPISHRHRRASMVFGYWFVMPLICAATDPPHSYCKHLNYDHRKW